MYAWFFGFGCIRDIKKPKFISYESIVHDLQNSILKSIISHSEISSRLQKIIQIRL